MLSKTCTCAIIGLDGEIVEVEVDIANGLPSFTVVGLPDTSVQESRERVRSAIRNSGVTFPVKKITVSLAPSDLRKSGSAYDFPIAVGILISSEQVSDEKIKKSLLLGGIGLDGSLRHIPGILPMVGMGKRLEFENVFVPDVDAYEASLVDGINIYPVSKLSDMVGYLRGEKSIEPLPCVPPAMRQVNAYKEPNAEISNVRGQEHAKRAIEIAAAGGHNLLMSGPPGSGKTLLARCIPSILPHMTPSETLEITSIYSVAGLLPKDSPIISTRPFRSPHYTISKAGLVGGGTIPRPGEITLSHRGVLFLDELPEFGYTSLDALRQPLEDRVITISRAKSTVNYPANFMLVGAMNPCPCGFYGDIKRRCTCNTATVQRYQRRISGPMMDRMDIFINVPPVEHNKLYEPPNQNVTSESIANKVTLARNIQTQRFQNTPLTSNSDMGPVHIWEHCQMGSDVKNIIHGAIDKLGLSARGFHRTLKVARTISDLAQEKVISAASIAEALQYRAHNV